MRGRGSRGDRVSISQYPRMQALSVCNGIAHLTPIICLSLDGAVLFGSCATPAGESKINLCMHSGCHSA